MPEPVSTCEEPAEVRADIAASWRRAALAGVEPAGTFDRLLPGDVDQHSSLLVSAGPVLDQLETSLAGTGYSTILGDRECRIVRRWFDDQRTRENFDALNLREGASLLEDTLGTNALGTVFETHRPVVVHGPEHFVEPLRRFSCYGHPIRHPLTRRIEGVPDITALMETANPLLPPLITRAVHEIEQRILGGSRVSEKSLLAAFQEASGHRTHAVLAIGEDIVMCNQAASDLLSPADVALLRVLADDPPATGPSSLRLTLETGRSASVTVARVPGAHRGVLLRVEERRTGPHLTPARLPRSVPARAAAPTLVHGPAGTGRSTRARELATLPAKVLRAATALLEGEGAWAREFASAMERTEGSVVVDGFDLLSDELLDLVIEGAERRVRPARALVGPGGRPGRTGSDARRDRDGARGADAAGVASLGHPRPRGLDPGRGRHEPVGPPDPGCAPGADRPRLARQPARAARGRRARGRPAPQRRRLAERPARGLPGDREDQAARRPRPGRAGRHRGGASVGRRQQGAGRA